LNGQWIGKYSGTNAGGIVADFDKSKNGCSGVVFAYANDQTLPRSCAYVDIPSDQVRVSLRGALHSVERGTGKVLTKEELAARFPTVVFPDFADTDWVIGSDVISLNWRTNIGTNGTAELIKSFGPKISTLAPIAEIKTWNEFKEHVLALEPWQFAFRGQRDSKWRLRTSFHRTGRASLVQFMNQDIRSLHRHLSGLTSHHFDLDHPLDYAAFLNLLQHHGYPTPILDWTESPFVAAYFAFSELPKTVDEDQKVRILVANSRAWNAKYERAQNLMPGFLHITFLEPLATNNARVVPQQSISLVTNIDDLETYIREYEKRDGTTYLYAIDLPAHERRTVMRELALMGITAGALFPGLDGACRQLRERFFDLAE
jgi:hypothetical protein